MISIQVDGIEYRFFSHLYAVSRCGKVLRKLAPAKPIRRKDGYIAMGRMQLLHRAVAICWLEKPADASLVHHKNGNKADNRADNLEWVTPKQHVAERHAGMSIGRHVVSKKMRQRMRMLRLGTKDSKSVRAKKREILLRVSMRKNACVIDGIRYRSFLAASKVLKIHFHTVRYRCLSKNFPNYQLAK